MTDNPREIKDKILALGVGRSDLAGCKSHLILLLWELVLQVCFTRTAILYQ